ncbi:MAG TPA: FAD:protein FMN transferase [Candidatus Hypogeohydataceae bacterium YC38]
MRYLLIIFLLCLLFSDFILAQGEPEPEGNYNIQVFLTEEQALEQMFPDCDEVLRDQLLLTEEDRKALETRLGRRIYEYGFEVYVGKEKGEVQGYAVITSEIGKFHPFDFIVAVKPNGRIEDLAVLVYRESRGGEVARRRFLHQFKGKSLKNPIRINKDIINITGATMSVVCMCEGVKKVLGVVEEFYLGGKRGLEGATPYVRRASSREPGDLYKETRLVMGTYAEVSVYAEDKALASQAIEEAFEELDRLDGLMSNYKSSSELSRINQEAPKAPTGCNEELLGVIERSLGYSILTQGAFDITVEPLVSRWGFYEGKVKVLEEKELEAVLPAVSYKNILIQGQPTPGGSRTIFFKNPQTRIDLGGIGKGYAADKAVEILRKKGITSACVNLGGNIYALGSPPGRETWRVGVLHPRQKGLLIGYLELRDKGVATSGDYERFFTIEGKRYSHIIDPRTGKPAQGVVSVTIVAPNATEADALSTGVFILGVKDGKELLSSLKDVDGLIAYEEGDKGIIFELTEGMNRLFKMEEKKAETDAKAPIFSLLKQ